MLAAIGCFASALTRNQIIAAVVALLVGLILYLLSYAGQLAPEGSARDVLSYLAIGGHLDSALSGQVRSEDLVYFAISIAFLLALVRASVESLRWR
jgi:ABC-2 type transport system permease protein